MMEPDTDAGRPEEGAQSRPFGHFQQVRRQDGLRNQEWKYKRV